MKHFFPIIVISILLLIGVVYGATYFKSATVKRAVTTNGNGGNTPEKTMEGVKLAGKNSYFFVYNKDNYQRALDSGKIVMLYFYANWCPFCRAEDPIIQEGFNSLTSDQLIGFRVNYNDDETDADEKQLATDFQIPYQHTKVFLEHGKEIARFGEAWDREDFDMAVNQILAR